MPVSTTGNSSSLLTPTFDREKGTTMPIQEYFGGHGRKVMASMKKTYGPEKAKSVFYATENKMKNEDAKVKARVRGQQRAMSEGSKMKG